jgi:hypothetical protein
VSRTVIKCDRFQQNSGKCTAIDETDYSERQQLKLTALITSMEEGRVSLFRPVPQNEHLPVCFKIDPLSKTSDRSALMSGKHRPSSKLSAFGITTLRNDVPSNAQRSSRSNTDPNSNVTNVSTAQN